MSATEEQVAALTADINAKAEEVRTLKAEKADADKVKACVGELLALKKQFEEKTGKPFDPPKKPAKKEKKEAAPQEKKDPNKKSKKELNKERKKAQKAAMKSGAAPTEDKPTEAKEKKPQAAPSKGSVQDFSSIVQQTQKENANGAVLYPFSSLPLTAYVVSKLVTNAKLPAFVPTSASITSPVLVVPESDELVRGDFAIARHLIRLAPASDLTQALYGDASFASQVDSWLDFALTHLSPPTSQSLELLDSTLASRTFILEHALSLADVAIWSSLPADVKETHVRRYLGHLSQMDVFASATKELKSKQVPASAVGGKPEGAKALFTSQKGKSIGNCPPLKDAVHGQVVTRFPPEPSGYLHIGHVKACMLNHYYARQYDGKLIVRFDDTNPSKEKDEFEQSILADLRKLDIEPDVVTYTSDYFEKIHDLARQLIQEGKAYMDDTPLEQMRQERMDGINSKHREMTPEATMKLFEGMLKNEETSQGYCLRAKIDMQAKNKTLRDPVLFRTNLTPHHRTGTKYKAYPTYDLACPIVDSIEGVTHALRTTEYNDRDFQYAWLLEAMHLRKVHIHGFARMNFVYSVLSKRKLQWFVDNQYVEGWNDPRFPTVQGVLRRGVQVPALREFILSQGASRRVTDMEWDKFWTVNKRVLEPMAKRYFAIDKAKAVRLTLTNVEDKVVGVPVPRHPKDASMGDKIMRFGKHLLIEKDDAKAMAEGEEVTLMRYGNMIVDKIETKDGEVVHVEARNNPEGDFKQTKKKITWLADVDDLVDLTLVEFDFLVTKPKLEEGDNFKDFINEKTRAEMKCVGDHELRNAKKGEVVQLERRGFFRIDEVYVNKDKSLMLFMVPDGKVRAMSTLSTNLTHR